MSVSNSEITRTPGSSTLLPSKISGPSEIASIFAKQLQRDSERSYFYELPKNLINDRKLIKATKSFIPELIKQHRHCDTITLKVSVIYSSIIKYALDTGFQFESANVDSAILKYQYRYSHIFSELFEQTRQHIQCLKDKGLGERSKAIQVKYFVEPLEKKELYDLTSFEKRTKIPQVVLDFDPSEKNTVITTDPNTEGNKVEDLTSILDIRLYPALRGMLHENNIEVFLGTKEEMACYYHTKKSKILYEISIPSSATYYLVDSGKGELTMVMAGLVGRENMIAQLLTLKLAGIDVTKVEIIGDLSHFSKIVDRDIQALMKQLPEIKGGNQALVIAGCGLEGFVNNLIIKERGTNVRASEQFHGDILSVIYTSLKEPQNGVSGIIVLHLNYGEIVERIISRLLQETCCPYIFSGGACGYIRGDKSDSQVHIGSRVSVTKSINEEGEIVCLGSNTEGVHLQVPSIFLETYQWLEKAKTRGSSVDIETFYILRAIQNHHRNNGYPVECDLGCFVSDFVGEVPLREYSKVYVEYQSVLGKFLGRVFDKQPTMKYHPDKQVDTDIVINSSFNDPKVPHHPMMDPAFVNTKDFESTKIDYRKKIQSLNPSYDKKNLFFNKKWDLDYFLRENNPIVLGKIVDTETYLRKRNDIGMRFLDMPIHMPGQGWRIPVELEQFKEVIEMAVQHEKTVNKNFEKLNYVYITVDQGVVEPGKAQRRVGWHGDSFLPIDTRKEKVDITGDRVYVVGDCCPTPFVPGPFSFEGVNLKSWKEISNHLETIANQFDPSFYEPYTLLRLDPYCIHNVGFNKKSGPVFRTFVKISVSEKQYTHLGNAHNPLFIYDWAMTPRKEVPYSNQVLGQSAHREDRDDFKEINPYIIDFNKDISRASWTKEKIFTVKKVSEISAMPVEKGETLPSYDQNFLVSILSSEDGDWKVTTKQNMQYFLSKEKLDKYYDADSERPGVFVSKPETRRMVEIKENIRFMAPWGTMVYAQKGDFLCFASDSDIYPVPQSIYYGDFRPVSE